MGANDFITLFFLVAAVLIFLQLRSVLGRRTGHEKPPADPFSPREAARVPSADDGKVVTLPKREPVDDEQRTAEIDAVAKPGTALNDALRDLVKADPSFRPKEFLNGARMAYEMIVMAFADGDRKTLNGLLSKDVFDGFDAAIREREARGETVKSTFVGIDKADVTDAGIENGMAQVTVRFSSQLISATRGRDGSVVEGDAQKVAEVTDVWTFAREVRSSDPNWKLVATDAEG